MERGFEQLFILVLIIVATLVDLLVRWIKRKTGASTPPARSEEPVLVEEEESDLFELELPRDVEAPAPPAPPPVKHPAPAAARVAAPAREPIGRTPPPESTAPVRGLGALRPTEPRRRRARHRLLAGGADARRAMVLLAVLGPCRGLAPDRRD